jgi:hypothetical protein
MKQESRLHNGKQSTTIFSTEVFMLRSLFDLLQDESSKSVIGSVSMLVPAAGLPRRFIIILT